MNLKGKKIGFALTGSFCTFDRVLPQIKKLVEQGAEVIPIMSYHVATMNTKFGEADEWKKKLYEITGRNPICDLNDAEPIGPEGLLDVLVIAPCTGNTMAKLANAITDTPVLMAAKSQLRNQRPVVLAVSTNDGLGLNAKNLGILLNTKNVYMVPFGQDNPQKKQNSLVANYELLIDTIINALNGKQLQPLLIQYA